MKFGEMLRLGRYEHVLLGGFRDGLGEAGLVWWAEVTGSLGERPMEKRVSAHMVEMAGSDRVKAQHMPVLRWPVTRPCPLSSGSPHTRTHARTHARTHTHVHMHILTQPTKS